jgi:hypothetical protein
MTMSAATAPAVRAAFTQFIDYAGLFPPAKLDMAPALAEYAAHQKGPYAWMLGRFIVAASRIPELLAALPPAEPLELSVIVDAGTDSRAWLSRVQSTLASLSELREREPRVRVQALETVLPPLQTQRETYDAAVGQFAAALKQAELHGVPAFVELPRDARWRSELSSALYAMSRHRLGAKLRCGGVTADAFAGVEEVAAFIGSAIREHGIAMKATAGLHHPVRHVDENMRVIMHGFLNLLAAAALAREGADDQLLHAVIASEDQKQFVFDERGLSWSGRSVSVEQLQATRAHGFIAYGSCSFDEPVGDLQALGML